MQSEKFTQQKTPGLSMRGRGALCVSHLGFFKALEKNYLAGKHIITKSISMIRLVSSQKLRYDLINNPVNYLFGVEELDTTKAISFSRSEPLVKYGYKQSMTHNSDIKNLLI